MTTITLSGMEYRAHSPSLFRLLRAPAWIAYDGRAWRIATNGLYGPREFPSRQHAADLIATSFNCSLEDLA